MPWGEDLQCCVPVRVVSAMTAGIEQVQIADQGTFTISVLILQTIIGFFFFSSEVPVILKQKLTLKNTWKFFKLHRAASVYLLIH